MSDSEDAVTDTEALRRAIDDFDEWPDPDSAEPWELVMTAARRWLALAEGDEAVVERMASVLYDFNPMRSSWESLPEDEQDWYRIWAIEVLAAITEGGE